MLATDPARATINDLILRHGRPFVLNSVHKILCALAPSFSIYVTASTAVDVNKSVTPNSVVSTHPNSSAATPVASTDTLLASVVVTYRLVIGGDSRGILTACVAAGSGSIPVDVVARNSAALKNDNRPNTFALASLTGADEPTRPTDCKPVRASRMGGA